MTEPRFPEVTAQLTGQDGNAFAILARVRRAMQHAGVSAEDQKAFAEEALSGDYNHLLATCMKWVYVE